MFCKWHGTPLNMAMHLFAFVVLIYGVWLHSWKIVGAAVIVAALGHLAQMLIGKKVPVVKKKR